MSRSYKKFPVLKDYSRNSTKFAKRQASKAFRKKIGSEESMPARPQHKKYTSSYNIFDYITRMTRSEAIEWYYYRINERYGELFQKSFPTLESWLNYWAKCYRRK